MTERRAAALAVALLAPCLLSPPSAKAQAAAPATPAAVTRSPAEAPATSTSISAASAGAPVTPAEAIGWRLFFDPALSRSGELACATCHDPERGFADGRPRAVGAGGVELRRHTPRLADLAGASALFWDGRAGSLEEQVLEPLTHPREMALTEDEIVARVAERPGYRRAFSAWGEPVALDAITAALAAFVRSLETGESAYDRWLAGERDALGAAAERGRMIFFTRGQCATCHLGPALTDHAFHNVATGTAADPGRVEVTGREADRGRFKTPSLRGVRGTGPFMHDGRFATLRAVIDHYSDPPPAAVGTSELDPLALSPAEKDDLEAFLATLDGARPDLAGHRRVWDALTADHPRTSR